MSSEITPRDRVWAEALAVTEGEGLSRTQVMDVHQRLYRADSETAPSQETVRRTMYAMAELGVLDHHPHSKWYRRG